jgi:hypothetical protein
VKAIRAEHKLEQAAKRKAERISKASRASLRRAIERAFGAEEESSQPEKVSKAVRTPLPTRAPAKATAGNESPSVSARKKKGPGDNGVVGGPSVERRKRLGEAAAGTRSEEPRAKKRKTAASDTPATRMPQHQTPTARPRPTKPKKQFIIDLTGDSDVEKRRKKRSVYVPADNSIFGAYEMTYNATMVGIRDPAVVVDGVNGPFAY